MQEVFVHMPQRPGDDLLMARLQGEINLMVGQRVRVYRTFVEYNQERCSFVTTSKDIHLLLGALSVEGRVLLAKLLNREFGNSQENQLLLFREPDKRTGILVTYSHDRDGHTFTLAPAH